MIRFRGTVAYTDGTSADYDTGTRALLAWESYARRNGIAVDPKNPGASAWTMLYVIAHYALTGKEDGFQAWADTVADLAPEQDSPQVVPPTLLEVQGG